VAARRSGLVPLAKRRDAAEHLFIETQPLPRLRPEDL
jgi:hypothetical protein